MSFHFFLCKATTKLLDLKQEDSYKGMKVAFHLIIQTYPITQHPKRLKGTDAVKSLGLDRR